MNNCISLSWEIPKLHHLCTTYFPYTESSPTRSVNLWRGPVMEAIWPFPATSCAPLPRAGPVQLSELTAHILGITSEKLRQAHQATRQLQFAVRTSSISCLLPPPKSIVSHALKKKNPLNKNTRRMRMLPDLHPLHWPRHVLCHLKHCNDSISKLIHNTPSLWHHSQLLIELLIPSASTNPSSHPSWSLCGVELRLWSAVQPCVRG